MSFVTIFGLCELEERISNGFEEIERSFDQLRWYAFPVKSWKMLPTVFIATKFPIQFNVFGNIACSREDFKMVR